MRQEWTSTARQRRRDGSVLRLGDFGGGALTSTGMDIFVAKYSSSGAHVWSRKYGAAGNEVGAGVAARPETAMSP
jgi:hypothetical protein